MVVINKNKFESLLSDIGIQSSELLAKIEFVKGTLAQEKHSVKNIDTSSYTEKQKKNFDYNQKQTEAGHALKTLNDSRIGRSTKSCAGKDILCFVNCRATSREQIGFRSIVFGA